MIKQDISTGRLTVGIYSNSVGQGLITLVLALLDGGHKVILFAKKDLGRVWTDHDNTYPFLERIEQLTMVDHDALPDTNFDVLFITWSYSLPFSSGEKEILRDRTTRAKRLVLLYDAQFGRWYQVALQEIRTLAAEFSWLRRVKDVCYMFVFPKVDLLTFLLRNRFPISVGPNLFFMCNESDRENLFAEWDPGHRRAVTLFASGTKASSNWRVELVDFLETKLLADPESCLFQHHAEVGNGEKKQVLWSFGSSYMPLGDYLDVMSDSDFTLCIPGTSWTHRPIESLARGSIPILDSENMVMHDIPWKDGVNCLIVDKLRKKESWLTAIQRAIDLSENDVLQMRRAILVLREERLLPKIAAQRLLAKMKIDNATVIL